MKTLTQFKYVKADSIDQAAELLSELGGEVKLLAGGTDLLVMIKDRIITPDSVIDILNIPGLNHLTWDDKDGLRIGALSPISLLIESDLIKDRYVSLHEGARLLGTPQIRNMATLGGNICRSSPSADLIPPLLIYNARINLVGKRGTREIALSDFITGPGTNVLDQEILTEILLPADRDLYGSSFVKQGRLSEDLAQVNCAVKVKMSEGMFKEVSIVLGAVAPMPIRAKNVEMALVGQEATWNTVVSSIEHVVDDISPISDVRASADYRMKTSKVLIKRAIHKALTRLDRYNG